MKLRFADGYEFTATDKIDACEQLRRSMKFSFYQTLNDWLEGNANVSKNAFGINLRTGSPEEHFDDMVKHGILKIIDK